MDSCEHQHRLQILACFVNYSKLMKKSMSNLYGKWLQYQNAGTNNIDSQTVNNNINHKTYQNSNSIPNPSPPLPLNSHTNYYSKHASRLRQQFDRSIATNQYLLDEIVKFIVLDQYGEEWNGERGVNDGESMEIQNGIERIGDQLKSVNRETPIQKQLPSPLSPFLSQLLSYPIQSITSQSFSKLCSTLRQLHRQWYDQGNQQLEEIQWIVGSVRKWVKREKDGQSGNIGIDRNYQHSPTLPSNLSVQPPSCQQSPPPRILIPGCGLGRLMIELLSNQYSCQGNQVTYFMLWVSKWLFNNDYQSHIQWKVCPWIGNVGEWEGEMDGGLYPEMEGDSGDIFDGQKRKKGLIKDKGSQIDNVMLLTDHSNGPPVLKYHGLSASNPLTSPLNTHSNPHSLFQQILIPSYPIALKVPSHVDFQMVAGQFVEVYGPKGMDSRGRRRKGAKGSPTHQQANNLQTKLESNLKRSNDSQVNPMNSEQCDQQIDHSPNTFPSKSSDKFNCITTLFFIDTAHNIENYIETIYHSLLPGGIWVNSGPLLYHFRLMSQDGGDKEEAEASNRRDQNKSHQSHQNRSHQSHQNRGHQNQTNNNIHTHHTHTHQSHSIPKNNLHPQSLSISIQLAYNTLIKLISQYFTILQECQSVTTYCSRDGWGRKGVYKVKRFVARKKCQSEMVNGFQKML